jgi:tetratricopeptide (TPR) repeat protein
MCARSIGAFVIVFAVSGFGAQLPESCKPPDDLARVIHATPSAPVYDAAGAWFAGRGRSDCASAAFEEAIRLDPQSAEAHFDLGLLRQRQGKLEAAAKEFRLALRTDPSLVRARLALGSVLMDSDNAAAETEFRKALEADPRSVYALDRLAQVLLQQKRYDAALNCWKEALRLQPDSGDLRLAYATGVYQSAKAKAAAGLPIRDGEDVPDAIRTLSELVKAHPDMTGAHFTLGNMYANEARYREAADEYKEVMRLDPSDTVALLARVKALVTVSAFDDALPPAQDYARKKPQDWEGHLLLGTVYRGLADYARAEPELEIAVTRRPSDSQARYQLGFVLVRLGRPQQALPHLRKAVELNPADSSAQFQLAAVLRALGDSKQANEFAQEFRKTKRNEFQDSQLTAQGNQANQLLQAGKAAEAAAMYRELLEKDPQNARTAYNLALASAAAHDSKGEREALERAVSLDPKMAVARADLGRLELEAGNVGAAETWLESALALEPQLVAARGNLAMIHAMKGDIPQAETLLRRALEDDPRYAQGHLNLGLILAQQGSMAEADGELDKALALAPQDVATLSAAGKAKARMGKTTEGIALLRKVVALAPDSAAAHLDLAFALADTFELPGALAETGQAVRLAPQSGVAHLNRGRVLFDLGRNADAQAELETASRLLPQMADPRYFLALIERQAGNNKRAAGLLQETLRLQPRNAMAWYLLGQSLDRESQTAEAVAAWRKAIEIDPNFSQALFSLARSLRPTDAAEADRFLARYTAVQKERRILDRAGALGNDGVASAAAHDWAEAIRQFREAIGVCGACALKPDLHKNLGLIYCRAGDIDNGEKELRIAGALKPSDQDIERALRLIAQARAQRSSAAKAAGERAASPAKP